MAHIRTLSALEDLGLTPAEQALLQACETGSECALDGGSLPDINMPQHAREIRAEVLRFLIIGGCDACAFHEAGVVLKGAVITGELDLNYCKAPGAIDIQNSVFEQKIKAVGLRSELINFDGSHLNGLEAQGMAITGSVLMRSTRHTRSIEMNGATVGGQLSLRKAILNVTSKNAITGQNIHVEGHMILHGLQANATLYLMSGVIGGQINFRDSTFGSQEGTALQGQSLTVHDMMIWKNVTVTGGAIQFLSAKFQSISTDFENWPGQGDLKIDGMVYDRISASKTGADEFLAWLAKGSKHKGTFRPQPYTQLAKVLHDMGHDTTARKVLEKREELLREDERRKMGVWAPLHYVFADKALKHLIGYGHRPFKSLWALAFLILAAIVPAHFAWDEGSMTPNSPVILNSQGWAAHLDAHNPADSWSAKEAAGQDWETFNRYAYGFDVVIPIINFGQTDAWAPSTNRGWWGQQLYWLRWVLAVAGWIVSALGAAAITGLIRRD